MFSFVVGQCKTRALNKKVIFSFLLFIVASQCAFAQSVSFIDEYGKRVKASGLVSPLTSEMFGEQVSLYNGQTEFSAADISIPGNNSLPVELRRRLSISSRQNEQFLGGFGEWDIDVPYIKVTVSASLKWSPNNRCSSGGYPLFPNSTYSPDQIWNGINMHVPGGSDAELLKNNSAKMIKPIDGQTYPWITKGLYQVRCLAATSNAYPGEGFLAVSPNGTKYYFDHGIELLASPLGPRKLETPELAPYHLNRVHVYLLATKIEDRFGNTINYTYSGKKLTSIASSDGRAIIITSSGDNIISATANGKVWQYQYINTYSALGISLKTIILPDSSKWSFDVQGNLGVAPGEDPIVEGINDNCPYISPGMGGFVISITHPSGTIGKFELPYTRHERDGTPSYCIYDGNLNYSYQRIPNFFDNFSLLKKTISGQGVATNIWDYNYWAGGVYVSEPGFCVGCNSIKQVSITDSTGEKTVYEYGVTYAVNEGRLISVEKYGATGTSLSKNTNRYISEADVPTQLFPDVYGQTLLGDFDPNNTRVRPIRSEVLLQDGVTFNRVQNSFDEFAKPTSVTKFSSLGYSRTDTMSYHNNLSKWVLGQVQSVTNTNTGNLLSKTEYDDVTALPLRNYSMGQTQPDTSFTYLPDGNTNTVKDALNRTTTLSNYYRGIPRLITFPDATTLAATVNATGTIASSTDQLGSVTQYTYDVMDRMAGITPPTGDTVTWLGATQTFAINTVAAYGLPAGHWKQIISKGNYRKEIYFNAMWQPIVTREYDTSNIAGTQRFIRMAYDTSGRPVFASYPGTTDALTLGVRTEYDALGRVTKTKQDSELGILNTTTEYLAGFQTRVTNPRGFATTTSYQVFDTPDTSRPEIIVSPQGMTTTMLRNVYGNTLSVTRSGVWNNAPINSTRSYVYDSQQRLCKRIEPETGATLMDYDAVGNLAWSVQGSALTSNTCDRASVAAADKTIRGYDSLSGRLLAVDVPGTINDLSYSYFNDGALQSLISGTNRWDYTYNKLRLPVSEQLTIDGRIKTLTHAYNNMAQESSLSYPSGLVVATTPNALGQASQAGTFATGVNYHPMGGMSIFNYGNGIVHRMTPNARQLPSRSWDLNGTIALLDDSYTFDANGNVASITDGTAGAGGNRTMSYDNADRLIQTNAPNLAWMSNTFSYDALDNIRANTLGGRAYTYQYNATTKRLDQLTLPNAAVARNLAYDPQGNVTTNGAQSYVFDKANRMESVNGIESYQYDGHGRRVKTIRNSDGKISYPIYSLEGKLLTDDDQRSNKTIDYVYLNGGLVAKRSAAIGNTMYTTSYLHTDALGSPVAESDAAKTVTFIKRYTPYGEPGDQNYVQGPGFTGHVMDAATGLTYMQQRYYDPMVGRFLSPDPMASDMNTGWNFNRYNYANNNPYRFTDPDGRQSTGTCDSTCDEYRYDDNHLKGEFGTQVGKDAISKGGPVFVETASWFGGAGEANAVRKEVQAARAGGAESGMLGKAVNWAKNLFGLGAPSAAKLSGNISKAFGVSGRLANNGKGQVFKLADGGVTVRVMEQGGGRSNYLRVSVEGKGSVDAAGVFSSDPLKTHIPINQDSMKLIEKIVDGVRSK